MKIKSLIATICVLILPLVAMAQLPAANTTATDASTSVFATCSSGIKDVTGILYWIGGCLVGKGTVMLIISITLIVFMVGALRYIAQAGGGNADYAKKLRSYLIWSMLALFVMLSVWGIVYFIGGSLGIGQGGTAPIPQFSTQ